MILLALGTNEYPFDRALDLVLPLADHESLVVQHGHTAPRPHVPGVQWVRFIDYAELVELMRAASAVVCHAGVGTIMTALAAGRTPVVIPRLRCFGEHADDHQLEIAFRLAEGGHVVVCEARSAVLPALEAARGLRHRPAASTGELKRAIIDVTRGDVERGIADAPGVLTP